MSHRVNRTMRRLYPLLGAGVLLQTGSCATSLNELGAQLTAAIANELITSFIFGVFNLATL